MLGVQIFFTGFIFVVISLFIVKICRKAPNVYAVVLVMSSLFGGLAAIVVGFLTFVWSWRL